MIGVVADDVTGANDIGIMFAKAGYLTHVYSYEHRTDDPLISLKDGHPDVTILDTNSRFDSVALAYDKVFAATKQLRKLGCTQFYNKTCSVFRGNIGSEFDAMLDALQENFAIVVLGFPKNGRITKEGIHYVHGIKLEDSEFRHDPVHPMTRSDLTGILSSQTKRKVGFINYRVISEGDDRLRAQIDRLKSEFQYVILDVNDQESLATIARTVHDEKVICGSSALAEELATVWGKGQLRDASLNLPVRAGVGVLCAAGSLMPQTAEQIRYLKEKGVCVLLLNPLHLFKEQSREEEIRNLADEVIKRLKKGEDVVLHSSSGQDMVDQVQAEGMRRGLPKETVSRLVSSTIAEIVALVQQSTGQNRLVVAGGDTSAAVCERLGIKGMRVWQEIQPGLPSCVSLTDDPMLLILKSGSFGRADFLDQAMKHLKNRHFSQRFTSV